MKRMSVPPKRVLNGFPALLDSFEDESDMLCVGRVNPEMPREAVRPPFHLGEGFLLVFVHRGSSCLLIQSIDIWAD
jgi:hypothetical protein